MFIKTLYNVKSGDGYFTEFKGDTPQMTSDPVEGKRMEKDEADSVVSKLIELGFDAKAEKIKIANERFIP
jgi:hypothetical protein